MYKYYFGLFLLILCGCTPVRYIQDKKIVYTPHPKLDIERNKYYPVGFDRAWQAAVTVFALNNYQIKTMDKESGLLAAESFYNPADMADMVHPGTVETIFLETAQKMKPSGLMGAGNPEYVRQTGSVASSETYEVERKIDYAAYPVSSLLNILITRKGGGVNIFVNTKFQAQDRVAGTLPSPISNGKIEGKIFGQLGDQLK
tara:strand:- start:320 stop:922 length:603 start_codon:yes stop_codon:yes gene_type:complete